MNDQQTDLLIETMRDLTRAVTALTVKIDTMPTAGGVPTSYGNKPGEHALDGVEIIALRKEWPDQYGWWKFKVGHGRDGEWLETKSKSIAQIVEAAREGKWFVDITYDRKRKGDFVNQYIATIKKVDGGGGARAAAPEPEPEPEEKIESPW